MNSLLELTQRARSVGLERWLNSFGGPDEFLDLTIQEFGKAADSWLRSDVASIEWLNQDLRAWQLATELSEPRDRRVNAIGEILYRLAPDESAQGREARVEYLRTQLSEVLDAVGRGGPGPLTAKRLRAIAKAASTLVYGENADVPVDLLRLVERVARVYDAGDPDLIAAVFRPG